MPRPPDTTCICLKCSDKPLLLRQISRDLAQKHLKKFGPAPLRCQIGDHAASVVPGPSSGLRRPLGDISTQSPRLGQLRRSRELDLVEDPARNNNELEYHDNDFGGIIDAPVQENIQPGEPALPSDTVYHAAELPPGPELACEIDAEDASVVPRAYLDNEPSCVRIAYLQAVYNNVYSNMPVKDTNTNLCMTLSALDAGGILPDHPRPVRTLFSARRRLGIDPDPWIIQYALCPRCWKHHTPQELLDLAGPECSTPGCAGLIYETKIDAKGRPKRHAPLISPQVSLIQSLRRMLRRKGFRKLIRDSRNTPLNQNENDDFIMTDIHDANLWHQLRTGIKREIGNYGTVRDVPVGENSERKLTDWRFGLHLIVNIDW